MKRSFSLAALLAAASFSAIAQPLSGVPLEFAKRLSAAATTAAKPADTVQPSGRSLEAAKAAQRARSDLASAGKWADLSGAPMAKAKRL